MFRRFKEISSVNGSERNRDRYYVLGQLVEAVNLLVNAPKAALLLPEIRSNLVMALDGAQSIEEIAGIPGRLTPVFGRITAPAYPAWGASFYTAAILLEILKIDASRRAAMEIKYTPAIVELVRKDDISIERLEIEENLSLDSILKKCLRNGILPQALYTEGGFAREGAVIITGTTAVEVVGIALRIAEAIKQD
jgi:predicted fused transcriptional regulator/phosphomethylpyrimidine kinase